MPGSQPRPRLRHDRQPGDGTRRLPPARWSSLLLLQSTLPRTLRRRPREVPEPAHRGCTAPSCYQAVTNSGWGAHALTPHPSILTPLLTRARWDPEVRQQGLALSEVRHGTRTRDREPAEQEDDSELRDMSRRLMVCAFLTEPTFVLAMSEMLPGQPLGWSRDAHRECLAAARVVGRRWSCGAVGPFFSAAGRRCGTRHLNMFTLIALGTSARVRLQFIRHVLAARTASRAPRHDRARMYYEASAVIVTLVLLGQVLELPARGVRRPALCVRCSACHPRPRVVSRVTVTRSTYRYKTSRSEIGCECGRARRCRPTAACSRVRARSMNRASPASRCRSRKSPEPRSSGGTLNGQGSFVMQSRGGWGKRPCSHKS